MRDGIAGIHGKGGTLESASYRIHWRRQSSNPTLSANHQSIVSNNLASVVGSQRAMRLFSAPNSASNLLKISLTRAAWGDTDVGGLRIWPLSGNERHALIPNARAAASSLI